MTDRRTTELKPCPFYGSEADVAEMTTRCDGMTFFKALCNDCFYPGANIHMWYKTEDEAIEAWNIRAELGNDTPTAEQVRECAGIAYFDGYSDSSVHRGTHIDETNWQAIANKLNAYVKRLHGERR